MRCKSLYLLSFSLAFLTNAMAREYLNESATPQFLAAEDGDDEYTNGFYEEDEYFADAENGQSQIDLQLEADSSEDCVSPFHRVHIGLRHNEARGIGYSDGYTTLEAFGIYDRYSQYLMPFFDLRGHVFNNGKLAGNVGIGERTLIPSISHTFGSYLYYDVRRVGKGLTVNQLSPGIELIGKRMEYRINGYFPVGNDEGHKYGYKFHEFDGHHIILKSKQYQAMKGFDAEVGAHITQSTKYDLYTAAGSYYVQSSHAHSWGGRTRLLGRYKEYVSLEAAYSYDNLFRSVIEGSIAVTLPFGGKVKRKGQGCPKGFGLLLSRASFAPSRFEIPIVKKVHPRDKAFNPATHKPWTVWFVNNLSSSAGTFHSPFPTLLAAQNASSSNDMIYVFPGDGTTKGMNAGISLKDGQQLFGSGISHEINTKQGKIRIPAFSNSYPLIANTASVITLANNNWVSGMSISTTAGNKGIDGLAGVSNPTIDRNLISGGADSIGVSISSTGNTLAITNNQLTAPLSMNGNSRGISVSQVENTSLIANISNNSISGFGIGHAFAPELNPSIAITNSIISGNMISNFGRVGIFVFTGFHDSLLQITENTILNNAGAGSGPTGGISVSVNLAPDSGSFIIEKNRVTTTTTNPSVNGILGQINLATGASAQMLINQNTISTGSGAGSVGLNLISVANGVMCTSITNNQISLQAASGTNGVSLTTTGTGIINVEDISGNIAPNIIMTGNINLVEENFCNP
ncbi:MAG: hypothetical protein JSR93_06055 [Verrucomicrobia bacterium]|nr:hypothetical protein [Verrucomicrobiota bacterium]